MERRRIGGLGRRAWPQRSLPLGRGRLGRASQAVNTAAAHRLDNARARVGVHVVPPQLRAHVEEGAVVGGRARDRDPVPGVVGVWATWVTGVVTVPQGRGVVRRGVAW